MKALAAAKFEEAFKAHSWLSDGCSCGVDVHDTYVEHLAWVAEAVVTGNTTKERGVGLRPGSEVVPIAPGEYSWNRARRVTEWEED